MFWLPAPGGGWVLQPSAPVLQGCVITSGATRGFGFTRSAHLIPLAVVVIALMWLCAYGHVIEVVGAVLAAVLIEAASNPTKRIVYTLRKAFRAGPYSGDS
ncbi:hypothetical protein [Streptomyces virginiae]|uniref:hypothetical protein n=1 Tax=Streptomyces virginiae TaxID=1961 RepID=UPI0022538971|nr:hypothetical protein [Streptomyces virginiae]MCX4960029.1 hypothetical protein [Streptomyces virginiae]